MRRSILFNYWVLQECKPYRAPTMFGCFHSHIAMSMSDFVREIAPEGCLEIIDRSHLSILTRIFSSKHSSWHPRSDRCIQGTVLLKIPISDFLKLFKAEATIFSSSVDKTSLLIINVKIHAEMPTLTSAPFRVYFQINCHPFIWISKIRW